MVLIVTDLDRTLLYNGKEKYDNTMSFFNKIIEKHNFGLVYISGRNINQIKDAIKKYKIPYPDYAVSLVGSKVYRIKNKRFFFESGWKKKIKENNEKWDIKKIKKVLSEFKFLELQKKEYQSEFKISYYLYFKSEEERINKIKEIKKNICGVTKNYSFVFSIDYPIKRGLIDILPKKVSKLYALNYIVKKEKLKSSDVVCCGDSGNDIDLLTSKYKSVLVANASNGMKKQIRKKKKKELYIAKNKKNLNGNYVSGIIQGLLYFDFIDKNDFYFLLT